MGVSLSGNLINLTVDAGDLGPDELAAMLGSYRKKKRYHRLRDGAFVDLSDFELAQLDRLASDLASRKRSLPRARWTLPSFRAFYLDEEADLNRDRSFTQYLSDFRAIDERVYQVPEGLNATLRPYQEEGLRWLSARLDAGFGGVLADEMGLGKFGPAHQLAGGPRRSGSRSRAELDRVPLFARVQLDGRIRALRTRPECGRRGGQRRRAQGDPRTCLRTV